MGQREPAFFNTASRIGPVFAVCRLRFHRLLLYNYKLLSNTLSLIILPEGYHISRANIVGIYSFFVRVRSNMVISRHCSQ